MLKRGEELLGAEGGVLVLAGLRLGLEAAVACRAAVFPSLCTSALTFFLSPCTAVSGAAGASPRTCH